MRKNYLKFIIPILVIILCFAFLGRVTSSPECSLNKKCIENLELKQRDVLGLTAGATGISTVISLLPGDAGSPIAGEFSDLVGYFILISAALFFEKYLVTVTGFLGFYILIPLGCILYMIYAGNRNNSFRNAAIKLAMFGLLLYFVNPMSYAVTKMVENTYDTSVQVVAESDSLISEIEETAGKEETEEEKTWLQTAKENVENAVSRLSDDTKGVLEKAKAQLSNYVEATAIMIITSCVIPLVVVFVFIWLVRVFLGIRIESPELRRIAENLPKAGAPHDGPHPEHGRHAHGPEG